MNQIDIKGLHFSYTEKESILLLTSVLLPSSGRMGLERLPLLNC